MIISDSPDYRKLTVVNYRKKIKIYLNLEAPPLPFDKLRAGSELVAPPRIRRSVLMTMQAFTKVRSEGGCLEVSHKIRFTTSKRDFATLSSAWRRHRSGLSQADNGIYRKIFKINLKMVAPPRIRRSVLMTMQAFTKVRSEGGCLEVSHKIRFTTSKRDFATLSSAWRRHRSVFAWRRHRSVFAWRRHHVHYIYFGKQTSGYTWFPV